MYCSPSRENLLFSCYNDEELTHLFKKIGEIQPSSRKKSVKMLEKHFGRDCGDQQCWTQKLHLKSEGIFRPDPTWYKNGWLSDLDIDNCLSQYEEKYRDFIHLGVERVDFWYYKNNGLRHKRIGPLLEKGIKKFSFVVNLYGYNKESYFQKHWITIFVDLDRETVDYFDSSNFDVIPALEFLLYELLLQFTLMSGKRLEMNKMMYAIQKNDGDCGIFAIDFVVKRLEGYSFTGVAEYYNSLDMSQKRYMNYMRQFYFSPK